MTATRYPTSVRDAMRCSIAATRASKAASPSSRNGFGWMARSLSLRNPRSAIRASATVKLPDGRVDAVEVALGVDAESRAVSVATVLVADGEVVAHAETTSAKVKLHHHRSRAIAHPPPPARRRRGYYELEVSASE